MLARLEDNLGDKKSPDAAAVVCEYIGDGKGPVMKYRKRSTAGCTDGPGVARSGYYTNASRNSILTTANTNVSDGWFLVNVGNSALEQL